MPGCRGSGGGVSCACVRIKLLRRRCLCGARVLQQVSIWQNWQQKKVYQRPEACAKYVFQGRDSVSRVYFDFSSENQDRKKLREEECTTLRGANQDKNWLWVLLSEKAGDREQKDMKLEGKSKLIEDLLFFRWIVVRRGRCGKESGPRCSMAL